MITAGTVVFAMHGDDPTEAIAWIKEQGLTKEDVRVSRSADMVLVTLKVDWHSRKNGETERV